MTELTDIQLFVQKIQRLKTEVSKVIVGHHDIIGEIITAIMSGGHVLLEGVPGIGKTMIVKTISRSMNLKFSRIQFTPDLMPADITGTNLIVEDESGKKVFRFQKGPVFGNIILADEINRTTPKTQSALLEAMQENTVTVVGIKYNLEEPFFVLATQNPIEMEGTYPLPEAQIDRFLFKSLIELLKVSDLEEIMERTTTGKEVVIEPILSGADILEIRKLVYQVPVTAHLKNYIARLVEATHPQSKHATDKVKKYVRYGASPRGAQAIILSGKATAFSKGRYNLSEEDIKEVALPALRHRLILNFEGEAEGIKTDLVISDLIDNLA
jgi:MoxR-like ATPase